MNSIHLLDISKGLLIGIQGWEAYVMPSGGASRSLILVPLVLGVLEPPTLCSKNSGNPLGSLIGLLFGMSLTTPCVI